jgi:hypothetical protein
VRLRAEREAAGPAEGSGGRIDRLEVLALVCRDARPAEAADLGVLGEETGQERRAASVQAAEEDKGVFLPGFQAGSRDYNGRP